MLTQSTSEKFSQHLATTLIASTSVGLVTWPLEMMKNFRQLGYLDKQYGAWQLIKKGPLIYRGSGPYIAYKCSGFFLQRASQIPISYFLKENGIEGAKNHILSGCISAFTAAPVVTPVDYLKLQTQMYNRAQYSKGAPPVTSLQIMRKIYSENKIFAPWSAMRCTWARNFVYDSVNLMFLCKFQAIAHNYGCFDSESILLNGLTNGLAGVLAVPFSYPLDVIKTRTQLWSNSTAKTPTFFNVAKKIFLEEGTRAFSRGLPPKLGAYAVGWFFFGGVKKSIENYCYEQPAYKL